jgi:hypothetical protein
LIGLLSTAPTCQPLPAALDPRAPSESTIAPPRALRRAHGVLSAAVRDHATDAAHAQDPANTGTSKKEAPRVASRGSCLLAPHHQLVGEEDWLPIESAVPTQFSG